MEIPSLHLSDDASPAKKDLPLVSERPVSDDSPARKDLLLVSAYLSPDSGSDYSAYDDSDPNRTSSDEDVYPNPAIYILDRYISNDVNDYNPALPDSENSSSIFSAPKKIVAKFRIPKYRRHRADKIRVGINGFGRIGRLVATVMLERSDKVELVAINDSLKTIETMKHKFDKEDCKLTPLDVVGTPFAVKGLLFRDNPVYVFGEKLPEDIPWDKVGVDFIVESTGVFTEKDKAAAHLKGGARKVIISGQSKDAPTIVLGVNEDDYKADVDVVCLPNSNDIDSSLVDLIVHMWTAKGGFGSLLVVNLLFSG